MDKDADNCYNLSFYNAVAAGTLRTGATYSSIKIFFSCLKIHMLAAKTYYLDEDRVGNKLEEAVKKELT